MGNDPTRRKFINILMGGGLIGWLSSVIYPVVKFLKPPKVAESTVSSVKIGRLEDIAPDTGQIFKFGRKPGILVRNSEGDLDAFHAICTHLDCIVQYRSDMGRIWCACHNGVYDTKGRNISGPPPSPLTPYEVHVRNGEVFISRSKS